MLEPVSATISLGVVSSAFTAVLRLSQGVYELKAVGEQTKELLDTIKCVNDSMTSVQRLRHQKSSLLNSTEKVWIDQNILNTQRAIRDVATLIEPGRVDMETNDGRISLAHRGLFVLRDSPRVAVHLSKLAMAYTGLSAAMQVLCAKEGRAQPGYSTGDARVGIKRESSPRPPPTYEYSQFLNRRRIHSGPAGEVPESPPQASDAVAGSNDKLHWDHYQEDDAWQDTSAAVESQDFPITNAPDLQRMHRNDGPRSHIARSSLSTNSRYTAQTITSPACTSILTLERAAPPHQTSTRNTTGTSLERENAETWRDEVSNALNDQKSMLGTAVTSTDTSYLRRTVSYCPTTAPQHLRGDSAGIGQNDTTSRSLWQHTIGEQARHASNPDSRPLVKVASLEDLELTYQAADISFGSSALQPALPVERAYPVPETEHSLRDSVAQRSYADEVLPNVRSSAGYLTSADQVDFHRQADSNNTAFASSPSCPSRSLVPTVSINPMLAPSQTSLQTPVNGQSMHRPSITFESATTASYHTNASSMPDEAPSQRHVSRGRAWLEKRAAQAT